MATTKSTSATASSGEVIFDGQSYPVRTGETALEALYRGGARVDYSCRKGSCHSCLLQVVEGQVSAASQRTLSPEQVAAGAFLPCVCEVAGTVTVQRLDRTRIVHRTLVAEKTPLVAPGYTPSGRYLRLRLEPPPDFGWRAGRCITLFNPAGVGRCYSIASVSDEDYFLDLHIRHIPGGAVSDWVSSHVEAGSEIELQGPFGDCYFRPELIDTPLLLLATGSGAGALLALAREALASGHRGGIWFYHGVREAADCYSREACQALSAAHPEFRYELVVTAAPASAARLVELAFAREADYSAAACFLFGNPDMVQDARVSAIAKGVSRERVFADPFTMLGQGGMGEYPAPKDREKLHALPPDPELWTALGEGQLLLEILEEFYTRVYADPRLAPFFHRITRQRAIEKQYEFLRDVLSGTRDYFGARPYNAHHWMVISDELFDYREELFFECVRARGMSEHLVRRWAAIDELFRPELVKASPRGLLLDGVEQAVPQDTDELLSEDSLCDGCEQELKAGTTARFVQRTGQLFCPTCVNTH